MFNQFTEQFSVIELAQLIERIYPGPVCIEMMENPRVEASEHYYKAAQSNLLDLGLQPHYLSDTLLDSLFVIARRHRHRADPRLFAPTVQWTATSNPVGPSAASLAA